MAGPNAVTVPDESKVRARHHLGYLNVNAASTYSLGVPAMVQTQFMIEGALNAILPEAYEKFRQMLCDLDSTERAFICGLEYIDVSAIDGLTFNEGEKRTMSVFQVYKYVRSGLANLLGIAPNPYDQRELVMGRSINARVGH